MLPGVFPVLGARQTAPPGAMSLSGEEFADLNLQGASVLGIWHGGPAHYVMVLESTAWVHSVLATRGLLHPAYEDFPDAGMRFLGAGWVGICPRRVMRSRG